MLKNENIICISSIDWDFNWQGHQEIMSTLARNGNRVLFIENTGIRTPTFKDIPRLKKRFINWFKSIRGFREEMEDLYVYSPVILPFPYSKIARLINKFMLLKPLRRWMKTTGFYNPIVWTFLPTGIALDIINNTDKKLLVYYCIADFYELATSFKKVSKTEDELISKSDLIFAQGNVLKEKCKRLNDKVYVFPFGVKIEAFENFQRSSEEVPADIRNIKRPIIGYVGGIHKHIDLGLIRFIAENHPEWSIALIGPIQTDISEKSSLQNVFSLGKKDFSTLPNYINEFDVAIIPYNISEYTATVFPTKLNEYHALGKPVVSTDLPEIAKFNAENDNLVFIGKTYKEFVDCISNVLNSQSDKLANQRIVSARRNSWSTRIEEMSNLIENALEKKAKGPPDWQGRFLKFYRATRRKAVIIGGIVLSIYLLLFYTSFAWFLARPLKISQMPEKADCIAVFGGGVGETGSPGKSTIERARYSVDLFKKGYSEIIIFSSGYSYKYNDASNMKLIALSLGVPEKNIILEQKAGSTYENVEYTKQILRKKGFDKILLVSSPYNMRRASLVFNHIENDIEVVYTPVPNPQFYNREGRVELEQIRAILHEYLGIIYYWWKGYI